MNAENIETKCEMAVMDGTGDTKIIWSKDNQDEIDAAKATFDALVAKGYAAFSVKGKSGEQGDQIKKFDPLAERIILVPQMAGG